MTSSSPSFFPLPQSELDDPHYPLGLTTAEKQWADLYPYLERRGFQLRPRYRPGWVGSWIQEGLTTSELMMRPTWRYEFDDAEPSPGALTVIDAIRTNDGTAVALKLISMSPSIITPDSNEIEILQYLSSQILAQDPRNHCIKMIDGFQVFTPAEMKDLGAAGYSNAFIAVFPFARKWKELPFRLAWEALECVRQLLEGLAFLHEHNIAHRDIRPENLMLDASSQCFSTTNPLDRIDTSVRYIFIDLGSATKFIEPRLVRFRDGWVKEIPEIYEIDDQGNRVPTRFYEPFKADVFVLGLVLNNCFGKFLPALRPLFFQMKDPNPLTRPSANQALELFHQYTRTISNTQLLRPALDISITDYQNTDLFTRAIAWVITFLWSWTDWMRLVTKVVWRGQELRLGSSSS